MTTGCAQAIRRATILLPILATAFLAVAGPHLRARADDQPAGGVTATSILLQSAGLPATAADAAPAAPPAANPAPNPAPTSSPALASVVDVRLADQAGRTRFVLEMTAAAEFDLYLLADPPRAVVDFSGLDWAADDGSGTGGGLIAAHRHGLVRDDTMRLVLDLTGPAAVRDVFFLPATGPLPYRFVLDLEPTDPDQFAEMVVEAGPVARAAAQAPAARAPSLAPAPAIPASAAGPVPAPDRPALPTVVLDAGHGGIDPGATGVDGLHEKHVTLDMAIRLAALLEETGRYRVVLTRDRDIYLRLRDRVAIARREGADLFLSLHADHYPEAWLRGASVYTVSDRASDREAAALARRENRADLIAGVVIDPADDLTASILIDLAQRRTLVDSARMADLAVAALGDVTELIPDPHRQAGFVVLKAPDVPSVLVELGYLSNADDERLLGTAEYRDRLARALVRAVQAYFDGAETLARN